MPSTAPKRIDTLRVRLEESDDIAPEDSELLATFTDRLDLLAQRYSDHRHVKLLRHGVLMAERLDDGLLADALHDRDAAEEIVAWINRTYDNEETNRDYRSALRVIGKRVAQADGDIETNENDTPVSLSWVPTGTPSTYDTTPDPRDMLQWEEDVKPI